MVRSALAVAALLCAAGTSFGQLYDNGPIVTHPGGMTGAVAGADRSAIGPGSTTFGNGFAGAIRLADDAVIAPGWILTSISIFGYTTGAAAPSATAATLRIWDAGGPMGGGTVVWGDTTTNVLTSNSFTNIYRTTAASTTDATRRIQEIVINLPNLALAAGTYWFDFSVTGVSFSPNVSLPSALYGGNAVQFGSTGVWAALTEGTAVPNPGVSVPFRLYGEVPAPSAAAGLGLVGLAALRRRRA